MNSVMKLLQPRQSEAFEVWSFIKTRMEKLYHIRALEWDFILQFNFYPMIVL